MFELFQFTFLTFGISAIFLCIGNYFQNSQNPDNQNLGEWFGKMAFIWLFLVIAYYIFCTDIGIVARRMIRDIDELAPRRSL